MKKKTPVDSETQVPDYTMAFLEGDEHVKKPKKDRRVKRIVIISILGTLAALLAAAGIWYWSVSSNPMGGFDTALAQLTPAPDAALGTSQTAAASADSAQPGATATPSPLDRLKAQADTSFLKDTVNILLIGVDHSVERNTEEWVKRGGKQSFHSDVMLILAVNKATREVNMISLPRDTYAEIPDVKGIYKLNASIDCGGGWPIEDNGYSTAGFDKVCAAASWMLGGIPVQYYYAVDMNAVKGLADAIGGVQGFDVEMDFKVAGRSYQKGVQDMDGQAVLDYLRVRQNIAQTGDLNRINRQKKMLLAIFDKIKKSGLLTSIPGLIDAFDGNLYTNVPLSYTAGLALFAMDVEPDSIGMYSMGGRYHNGIFNWNFVITDQEARVALIQQIYGVTVDEYADYAAPAATRLWEKMRTPVVKSQGLKALAKVKAKLDADAALPPYVPPTPTPTPAPSESTPPAPSKSAPPAPSESAPPAPSESAPPVPSESAPSVPSGSTPPESAGTEALGITPLSVSGAGQGGVMLAGTVPAGYRQHPEDGPAWTLYRKAKRECENLRFGGATAAMKAANEQAMKDVTDVCTMFGIAIHQGYWDVPYENNPRHNEVPVDFR